MCAPKKLTLNSTRAILVIIAMTVLNGSTYSVQLDFKMNSSTNSVTVIDNDNDDDINNGLPLVMQIVVVILYATVTFTAVVGNLMVIYIVLGKFVLYISSAHKLTPKNSVSQTGCLANSRSPSDNFASRTFNTAFKRLRTATNVFIINLSLADLFMALTCIPFHSLSTLILMDWPFGAPMCAIVNFTNFLSILVSAYTLLAISIDRFFAIVHPLRRMSYSLSRKRAIGIVWCIWLMSCIVPLPVLLFNRLGYNNETGTRYCYEQWPDSTPPYENEPIHSTEVNNATAAVVVTEEESTSKWRSKFEISVILLQYFCPALLIAYNYGRICYTLRSAHKTPPGEANTLRDQMLARQKNKLTKMMLVVVTFFIIAWLPLNTFNLMLYFFPNLMESTEILSYVWFACHWLAMSSACHNPIIYGYMNSKFRTGYKYCFYSLICCRHKISYRQVELHLLSSKRSTLRAMEAMRKNTNPIGGGVGTATKNGVLAANGGAKPSITAFSQRNSKPSPASPPVKHQNRVWLPDDDEDVDLLRKTPSAQNSNSTAEEQQQQQLPDSQLELQTDRLLSSR